jgi:hypothetical protein
MKTITWIYEHCSEYGYFDYQLYDNDTPTYDEHVAPAIGAFKDSIIYRIGGNSDAVSPARTSMINIYKNNNIVCTPLEVSIWCELVYDMSWQYCNSLYFQISSFEISGFQDPTLWCDVGGQGIGGTAYIHTEYASGVDSSGIVLDNEGEQMDTKYVNGYFAEMELSDDTNSGIFNESFTCSWGSASVFDFYTPSPVMSTIHTKKLFGIGEAGNVGYADTRIIFYDEPTLYWFNISFILQNCI